MNRKKGKNSFFFVKNDDFFQKFESKIGNFHSCELNFKDEILCFRIYFILNLKKKKKNENLKKYKKNNNEKIESIDLKMIYFPHAEHLQLPVNLSQLQHKEDHQSIFFFYYFCLFF